MEQFGDVVSENEPLVKRRIEKDGTVLPEVFEIWEGIEQLLRDVEEETDGLPLVDFIIHVPLTGSSAPRFGVL